MKRTYQKINETQVVETTITERLIDVPFLIEKRDDPAQISSVDTDLKLAHEAGVEIEIPEGQPVPDFLK